MGDPSADGMRLDTGRLDGIRRRLETAADRRALSEALDELAGLARHHEPARHLLLAQIVERDLAMPSVRAYFFDEAAIDDAVSETVLAVAAGIAGFRGEAAFLTWLDRVARNTAGQIRRRSARRSEPVSNEVPDVDGWARRVSSIVADEQTVARALSRLSEDHRRIIVLREIEDRSYDDIADRLGVPVGTVRSRLTRARQHLADLLVTAAAERP